jgi:hypothetical protein
MDYPTCIRNWGCLDHLTFSGVVLNGKAEFRNIACPIHGPGQQLDDGDLIEVIMFAQLRGFEPREFVRALQALDRKSRTALMPVRPNANSLR